MSGSIARAASIAFFASTGILRLRDRQLLAGQVDERGDGLQHDVVDLYPAQRLEQLLLGRLLGSTHVVTSSAA